MDKEFSGDINVFYNISFVEEIFHNFSIEESLMTQVTALTQRFGEMMFYRLEYYQSDILKTFINCK